MPPRSLSLAIDSMASDSHPWAQDDSSREWGFPSPCLSSPTPWLGLLVSWALGGTSVEQPPLGPIVGDRATGGHGWEPGAGCRGRGTSPGRHRQSGTVTMTSPGIEVTRGAPGGPEARHW